jgi:hypothetical protein
MKMQRICKIVTILSGFLLICNSPYAQTGNTGIGTYTPGSKLTVNGSFAAAYNNINATTYTLLTSDYYVAWNGSSAGTITLPAAIAGSGNFSGRVYHIKNTSTSNSLTVAASGSELIDDQSGAGNASTTLPAGYYGMFISKGTTSGTTWEVAIVGSSSTSTPTGADNGLTVGYNSTGKMGLGGTLAKTTDVALNGFDLTYSGTGNVGVGTTSPGVKFSVVSTVNNVADFDSYISGALGSIVRARSARGTAASPTATLAGDVLGSFRGAGYTGSGFATASAYMNAFATENFSTTGNGTALAFFNTPNTTAVPVERMRIAASGFVGINTVIPRTTLDVNGALVLGAGNIPNTINITYVAFNSLRPGIGESEFVNYRGTGTGGFRFYSIANTGTPAYATNAVAFIDAAGNYSATSDARAKSNIQTLGDGLDKIMAIRPVSYDMHTSKWLKDGVVSFGNDDRTIPCLGFLAQELSKVVPEAVNKPKDEANEFYTVSYSTIIPVLTKAIQEQQAEIAALKKENAAAAQQATAAATKYAQLAERVTQMEQMLGVGKKAKTERLAVK